MMTRKNGFILLIRVHSRFIAIHSIKDHATECTWRHKMLLEDKDKERDRERVITLRAFPLIVEKMILLSFNERVVESVGANAASH